MGKIDWAAALAIALGGAVLGLAACGDGADEGESQPTASGAIADSATPDRGGSIAELTVIGGCSPDDLPACEWTPTDRLEETVSTEELSYIDITGATRRVPIAIHRPVGALEPMAIVIFSHGGFDGKNDPTIVGTEWARVFTSAGYLSVHIAHVPRDASSRLALCAKFGVSTDDCQTFKHLWWDRPHDVATVLDWLEEQAAGPLAGRIDASRIAYAGHSAGAFSTLQVNGAVRDFAGERPDLSDPRPIAFIALSDVGLNISGFPEVSYEGVVRPHLHLSGEGDDTPGVDSSARRPTCELEPPGDKFRGWITEEAARHTSFNFQTDECERYSSTNGLDPERCRTYRIWLASAVIAFLDGYLRDDADARAYLESDNMVVLSGGVMEWDRR